MRGSAKYTGAPCARRRAKSASRWSGGRAQNAMSTRSMSETAESVATMSPPGVTPQVNAPLYGGRTSGSTDPPDAPDPLDHRITGVVGAPGSAVDPADLVRSEVQALAAHRRTLRAVRGVDDDGLVLLREHPYRRVRSAQVDQAGAGRKPSGERLQQVERRGGAAAVAELRARPQAAGAFRARAFRIPVHGRGRAAARELHQRGRLYGEALLVGPAGVLRLHVPLRPPHGEPWGAAAQPLCDRRELPERGER